MMSKIARLALSYPVDLIFIGVLAGSLYVIIDSVLLNPLGKVAATTKAAHDEVAEIYKQRRPVTGLSRPVFNPYSQQKFDLSEIPGLIALGDECHPPRWCECWIAWGPARDRGIEKDVGGGWHLPKASLFPAARPDYFDTVDVRRIDADAYSVLSCGPSG